MKRIKITVSGVPKEQAIRTVGEAVLALGKELAPPAPPSGDLPNERIAAHLEAWARTGEGRRFFRELGQLTRVQAEDATQGRLSDGFLPNVRAWFETLEAEYPAGVVAEQAATTPDLERLVGEWFDTDAGQLWAEKFKDALADHYQRVFTVRGQDVLDELGFESSFTLKNPEVVDYLERQAGQRITGMNDETIRRLMTTLAEGVDEGEGIGELGRRLRRECEDMTRYRAELIARTETCESFSYAAVETYRRNGITKVRWLTAGDDNVSDQCRSNEAAGAVPIDEAFPSGHEYPPSHPACRCALVAADESWEKPAQPWTGE